MFDYCWAGVVDVEPTLTWHWVDVSCLFGRKQTTLFLNFQVHSTSEKVDTQNREHVIFSISVSKLPEPVGEGPPVMVAQTRKHAEKQILKEVSYAIIKHP